MDDQVIFRRLIAELERSPRGPKTEQVGTTAQQDTASTAADQHLIDPHAKVIKLATTKGSADEWSTSEVEHFLRLPDTDQEDIDFQHNMDSTTDLHTSDLPTKALQAATIKDVTGDQLISGQSTAKIEHSSRPIDERQEGIGFQHNMESTTADPHTGDLPTKVLKFGTTTDNTNDQLIFKRSIAEIKRSSLLPDPGQKEIKSQDNVKSEATDQHTFDLQRKAPNLETMGQTRATGTELAVEIRLAILFGADREIEFEGPDADINAQRMQAVQTRSWQSLVSTLLAQDNWQQEIQTSISQALSSGDRPVFSIETNDQTAVLKSLIPLLAGQRKDLIDEIKNIRPGLVWAAIFVECASILQDGFTLASMPTSGLADLIVYLNGRIKPRDSLSRIGPIVDALNQAISDAKHRKKELEEFLESERQKLNEFCQGKSSELDAFKALLGEKISVGSGIDLWASRARTHRIAFFVWFFAFGVSGFVALYYLLSHVAQIATALPRVANGQFPYFDVLLAIVPMLGFAWLLRIISKLITANRIIADDASHRKVLTQIYLGLVTDKESETTVGNRRTMLTAIFRPLPGMQHEDVTLPAILNALKKERP